MAGFDHTVQIEAEPARVLTAFLDPDALAVWWKTARAVVAARPLGVLALEWDASDEADDLLGRLGGVFHGTVIEHEPGRSLVVADAWWLPPDTDPLGPMALEVTCEPDENGSRLRVRQTGFEDAPRWQRYYAMADRGWRSALAALKNYVEAA